MTDLLESLRTFIRVVERGSFSAVARETHASQTTIARRIDGVEQHFGVTLFERSTRRLILSAEGAQLLDHGRLILAELEQAETILGTRSTRPKGVVRVGVTTALGLFLAARLGPLLARYPDLDVEFFVGDQLRDMGTDGLDLTMRIGTLEATGETVRALGAVRRVLVASPVYLDRHGVPAGIGDLTDHQCIVYGYGQTPVHWRIDGRDVAVRGQFKANSSEAVQRAVMAGLGIGLLPWFQVVDQVRAGALVTLLPDSMTEPIALSIVHATGRYLPARTHAMIDFITDMFDEAVG